MYSSHLFLISSASIMSLLFLSFDVIIFGWNVHLILSVFLKKSLVLPFLLFSSMSLHCSLKKALSLLATLWNSVFSCMYLSLSLLLFTSLLSSTICKASSDNHFVFLHFFYLRIVLITDSYTMFWTSIHSFSSTLSTKSNTFNLFITSTV